MAWALAEGVKRGVVPSKERDSSSYPSFVVSTVWKPNFCANTWLSDWASPLSL